MFRLLLFFALLAALPSLRAQTAPPAQEDRPFFSRIQGLFDVDLPNIDPPGTVKVILHPHVGDFVRRDYMRLDVGLRWAINDHFEISPEASAFFTHGLGGSTADGYGIGEVRLGAKYIFRHWPDTDYETSVFLNVEIPTGQAPIDLTDGFNHFAPGFLIQRHSARFPKLITFAGAGVDLVSDSDVAGTPVRNQPLDDSMNFTAGAIYDLGQIKWTVSTTYATTAALGASTENFYYIRPGVLWYVPKKYTFNSKTQWILGLGIRASWGPDGREISFSNRVRAEITFRQVMEKLRGKNEAGR